MNKNDEEIDARTTIPSGPMEDIELVAATLGKARQHNLEVEVVWSALVMAAEANEHGLTMEQVLEEALEEWDIGQEGQQGQSAETLYALSVSDWSKSIEASDQKINAALYEEESKRHRGLEINPDGYVTKLD